MMQDAIKNFAKQFAYEPILVGKKMKKYKHYIVAGMGGSRLPALILRSIKPEISLSLWNDYGLPVIAPSDRSSTCLIASSYSGNTEETIDAMNQAMKKKIPVVVIAVGGKLIDVAKANKLPYVQLPNTGIQPRSALGFSIRALCKVLGEETLLRQSKSLAKTLNPTSLENTGKELAAKLKNKVPVIYSSNTNVSIAYNWKIKFNETGKIPAFYNVLPELNHNEMNGFDVGDSTRNLSAGFHFIFLKDVKDNKRVQKRFAILEKLYRDRGLAVTTIELAGKNQFEKIFSSLILADWAAVATAELYGLEPEQVPMVEEFKKLMTVK